MKKIYTFEAIKFGFIAFFKDPLFFLYAFVFSKLLLLVGLLISLIVAMPFWLHFFRFAKKIYLQILEIIPELNFKTILFEGVGNAFEQGVESSGGFLGFAGGIIQGIVNGEPFELVSRGVGGVKQGVSRAFIEKIDDLQGILQQVLTHRVLFVYFMVGLFLFLLCAKLSYDFFMIGWAKFSIHFYDTGKKSVSYLFGSLREVIKYIFATVLFLGIAFCPIVLFFWLYLLLFYFVAVPIFIAVIGYSCAFVYSWYLMLRLWFYPYFIVDSHISAFDSLKKSYNLGIGFVSVAVSLMGFGLILGIPVLISVLFPHIVTFIILGIILLIVWISSWISYAFLYRRLRHLKDPLLDLARDN